MFETSWFYYFYTWCAHPFQNSQVPTHCSIRDGGVHVSGAKCADCIIPVPRFNSFGQRLQCTKPDHVTFIHFEDEIEVTGSCFHYNQPEYFFLKQPLYNFSMKHRWKYWFKWKRLFCIWFVWGGGCKYKCHLVHISLELKIQD